jgi:hypothetical protein
MEGAQAIRSVDKVTPIMVGPGSYYKLYLFTDSMYLDGIDNVIYTFDYFNPDKYIFNEDVDTYPGTYKCNRLYKGWVLQNCPGGNGDADIQFDADWHENNFKKWAVTFRDKYNVPVYMNQWNVVHGVKAEEGREQYIADVARLS